MDGRTDGWTIDWTDEWMDDGLTKAKICVHKVWSLPMPSMVIMVLPHDESLKISAGCFWFAYGHTVAEDEPLHGSNCQRYKYIYGDWSVMVIVFTNKKKELSHSNNLLRNMHHIYYGNIVVIPYIKMRPQYGFCNIARLALWQYNLNAIYIKLHKNLEYMG